MKMYDFQENERDSLNYGEIQEFGIGFFEVSVKRIFVFDNSCGCF